MVTEENKNSVKTVKFGLRKAEIRKFPTDYIQIFFASRFCPDYILVCFPSTAKLLNEDNLMYVHKVFYHVYI